MLMIMALIIWHLEPVRDEYHSLFECNNEAILQLRERDVPKINIFIMKHVHINWINVIFFLSEVMTLVKKCPSV